MAFLLLIIKSAFRNRLRTFLTSVGVAIAIIAFLFLRTFIAAWYAGVDASSADRMVVRNKTAIIFPLPLAYASKIKNVPGVASESYANWFGGYYKDPKEFFAKFAIEEHYLDQYPEAKVEPAQQKAWLDDKTGAIVGDLLAAKYGWKLGDHVTMIGDIYPGNWEFNIRAIYTTTAKSFDRQTMFFHWSYLNDAMPDRRKDQIGIILFKVNDAGASTQVASAVDAQFSNSDYETLTESEKAFNLEFLSMSSKLIAAIQIVSFVVLAILMLILANTLAMATRERTTEYAVMRAIGFRPNHVVRLVIGEGFVIAFVGAALGVGLATPVLQFFAKIFQTYLGPFLGAFELDLKLVGIAVLVALAGGMLSAALPAWRAGRLKIVDALRRVE
jgi:putative ABC transport system permease protein